MIFNNKKETKIFDLKIGSVINYNFLYSNDEYKIGLVVDIKKDPNFSYIIYLINDDNEKDAVPLNILEYTIIG